MSNQNLKVVYSLRMHIELKNKGFNCLTEMPNPQNTRFNCWVYEATPEFMKAFDEYIRRTEAYESGKE